MSLLNVCRQPRYERQQWIHDYFRYFWHRVCVWGWWCACSLQHRVTQNNNTKDRLDDNRSKGKGNMLNELWMVRVCVSSCLALDVSRILATSYTTARHWKDTVLGMASCNAHPLQFQGSFYINDTPTT